MLKSATVSAPDVRGGMACSMAALLAEGVSTVASVETVERGYESLCEKLRNLGADISLVQG